MPQLHNLSPFAASTALLYNEEAVDTLYVMVKAVFNIGKGLTLADEQPKPFATDVYWTEPGKSSIRYGSDLHIGKPATDIVMLGHACAPGQQEATALDVGLTVGKVGKKIQVFGDRTWKDGRISTPAPFKTLAMVYEKAYGGTHIVNGQVESAEMRNPVGRGFAGTRKPEAMNGLPLPNLEDPKNLIRDLQDQPTPACFGFCAPHWQPRALLAGTYDEDWRNTRAPFLPKDFDKRSLNMAHADLIYPGFLEGDEPVQIVNMHPHGPIQFDVPRVKLVTRIAIAGQDETPEFNLETLILEPNAMTASLVWRAALPCDKKVMKIRDVRVTLSR